MKHPVVNGTEYNRVDYNAPTVSLSSTKHAETFTTTMEELATQYGVKTAWSVRIALMAKSVNP